MATVIDDLVYVVSADISGLNRALKESQNKAGNLTKTAGNLSKDLQRHLKVFVGNAKSELAVLDQSVNKSKKEFGSFTKGFTSGFKEVADTVGLVSNVLTAGIGINWVSDIARSAGEAERALIRLNIVYGDSADAARAVAENLSRTYGVSKSEIVSELGFASNLLTSLGISKKTALEMSETLVNLGADLYATSGAASSLTEAVHMLSKSLIGTEGARTLKEYGVALKETDLKKFVNNTDSASTALARYSAILERTSNIQGKFSQFTDTYLIALEQYKGSLEELKVTLGEQFLPTIVDVLKATQRTIDFVSSNKFLSGTVATLLEIVAGMKSLQVVSSPLVKTISNISKSNAAAKAATEAYNVAVKAERGAIEAVTIAEQKLAAARLNKQGTAAAASMAETATRNLNKAHLETVAAAEKAKAAGASVSASYGGIKAAAAIAAVAITVNLIKAIQRSKDAAKDLKKATSELTADMIKYQTQTAISQARSINDTYAEQEKSIEKYKKKIDKQYDTIKKINKQLSKMGEDDSNRATLVDQIRTSYELINKYQIAIEGETENQRQAILQLADTYRSASDEGKKSIEIWFPQLIDRIKEASVELDNLEESGVNVEQMLEDLNATLPTLPTNLEKVTDQIVKLKNELKGLPEVTAEIIGLDFSKLDEKYDEYQKQLIAYKRKLVDSLKTDTPENKELTENFTAAIAKELTPIIEDESLSYDERIKKAEEFVDEYSDLLKKQGLNPDEFKEYYKSLLSVDKWYAEQRELVQLQNQKALKNAYEGFFEQSAEAQLAANLKSIEEYKEADKELAEERINDEEELQRELMEIDRKWELARVQVISQYVTDKLVDTFNKIGEILANISDNSIAVLEAKLDSMQDKYDQLQELIDKRNDEIYDGMTVKQKDAILRQKQIDKEELERQKKQIEEQEDLIEEAERKAFERQKAIDIATAFLSANMAALGAYTSVMNSSTLSSEIKPVLAAIQAATAYAYGIAQIAAISSQQFPSYDVGAYNLPQDQSGVTVHKGEMIIPRPFAEDIRANGGFGGGDVVVNVYGTKDDVEVEASEGEKYKQIDIYVSKKVKGMVATGQLDNVLQQRFAVSRNGRRG